MIANSIYFICVIVDSTRYALNSIIKISFSEKYKDTELYIKPESEGSLTQWPWFQQYFSHLFFFHRHFKEILYLKPEP